LQLKADGIETSVASIKTREIVKSQTVNEQKLSTISIPEEWRINAQPFINRPFYLGGVSWTSSNAQFSLLPFTNYVLPGDIIRSNASLLNAMKMASYYRPKLHLNISLAGTITHAGCLLVGVLPPFVRQLDLSTSQFSMINSILSGPHAFLHANEATSVDLAVPWYCNTDVASLDLEETAQAASDMTEFKLGNYGTLVLLVLNSLAPSTGSSTSLNIVVDAIFHNLDMLIPSSRYVKFVSESLESVGTKLIDSGFAYAKTLAGDAIDSLRGGVRDLTGMHNPNGAVIEERVVTTTKNFLNAVDTSQRFQKLDPYSHRDRILEEPIFNTDMDEMQLRYILGKKQYLSTFTVSEGDPIGKLKFARPISPYQGGLSTNQVLISNNIELLYWMSRAWSGKLKLSIQSVMNNKQQVKLRVFNMYNVSKAALSGFPQYVDILNSPSHLLEFTAGGQVQEVELPFLCRTEQLYCGKDSTFAAMMHGMYYIYVAQQLANSSDSPTSVSFNIYLSAEDVKFYGYAVDNVVKMLPIATLNAARNEFKSESLNVMNEPADQKSLNETPQNTKDLIDDRFRLVQAIDLRPYMRRMYRVGYLADLYPPITVDPFTTSKSVSYNVSEFTGDVFSNSVKITPAVALSHMFYGKTGGIKVRLVPRYKFEHERPSIEHLVRFYPPDQYWDPALALYRSSATMDDTNVTATPAIQVSSETDSDVIEFVVPNMNCYKFVGSPGKLNDYTLNFTPPSSDLGRLVIAAYNNSNVPVLELTYEVWIGFTDETRFGFHCLAPVFQFSDGNVISSSYGYRGGLFSSVRNPYVYYG